MPISPFDPSRGPRAKIERAKEHLLEFEHSIFEFLSTKPYTALIKLEADGFRHFRAKVKEPIPVRIGTIVGDIIHNTRSALDYMACHFVAMGDGKIDSAKLPFWSCRADFEKDDLKHLKKASQRARRFIKRLKPYTGGNSTLRLLHDLDLRDKHRLIIPVGSAYRHVTISPVVSLLPAEQAPQVTMPADTFEILEDGQEFYKFPVLPEPFDSNLNFQLRFEICLSGVKGLPADQSAAQCLRRLVTYAEKIISIAERRLF